MRGLDDTPVTIGIFASLMIGIIASVALEQCQPMIALTLSCTSRRAVFAPSVGLQRLSSVMISTLRPSNPPAALISSSAISTPHFSHCDASAAGPVVGVEKPMRIGCCARADALTPAASAIPAIDCISVVRIGFMRCSPVVAWRMAKAVDAFSRS